MKYPDQYLHVTECRSGETWTVPLGEHDLLDLEHNLKKWIASEFAGELELDKPIMPNIEGDYSAAIITDNRSPYSGIVWQSGGFYLKSTYPL